MIEQKPLIVVENDIAIPRNEVSLTYYEALNGLKVGESFKYKVGHSTLVANQINNAKTNGKSFTTKKENDFERRVWRIR